MNTFHPRCRELLAALLESDVKFLIVGGYAVNYHGYPRATGDLDLWVRPDNAKNKERLLQALETLGVTSEDLKILEEKDFSLPLLFSDGEEPDRTDIMTAVSGVKFDDAWEERVIAHLDELELPFINLDDLVLSKISNDRQRDRADVEELQRIRREK